MALENSHKNLTKKSTERKNENSTNEWQIREKVSFGRLF